MQILYNCIRCTCFVSKQTLNRAVVGLFLVHVWSPSFSMQLQRYTTCCCIRRVQSWPYVRLTAFRRWWLCCRAWMSSFLQLQPTVCRYWHMVTRRARFVTDVAIIVSSVDVIFACVQQYCKQWLLRFMWWWYLHFWDEQKVMIVINFTEGKGTYPALRLLSYE